MTNYIDLDFTTIKFKKPIKYANGYYISITDLLSESHIIQTPKLKICYSCNKINSSNSRKQNNNYNYNYNYSVSVIPDFAKFIEQFEEVCIQHLKQIKHTIILSSSPSTNFTFNSATSASDDVDPVFKIKLITDKDGNIMTLLNLHNGVPADISYLKIDNSVVQYIECSGISITNEGQVYPIWIAHQIVIIPFSKIYKKKLLLDVLHEMHPESYVIIPKENIITPKNIIPENRVRAIKDTNANATGNAISKGIKLTIDPNMLQKMRSKLKPSITAPMTTYEPGLVKD